MRTFLTIMLLSVTSIVAGDTTLETKSLSMLFCLMLAIIRLK